MKTEKKYSDDSIVEFINSSKYLKIGSIVILSLVGLYVLGHTFKIVAHTVRGYKEMSAAFQN